MNDIYNLRELACANERQSELLESMSVEGRFGAITRVSQIGWGGVDSYLCVPLRISEGQLVNVYDL